MFPTLTVTSGNRVDKNIVEDAQYLLKGNNRFKEAYYDGTIDGIYGPATGAAAHRAKFWTGYLLSECDTAFGAVLYSYLLPLTSNLAKPLPIANRLRRAYRLAHKPKPTLAQQALTYGLQFVGYRESYRNNNMFGAYYGINFNPWCGCFVSYCYTKVGHWMFWPYVPTLVGNAWSSWHGVYVVTNPQPGDLVAWDWNNNGTWDHVEMFMGFGNGTVKCLGGNTLPPGGIGDFGNGGGVYINDRPVGIHHVFIRVAH